LNGTRQLLVCADKIGRKLKYHKEKTEALLEANKDVDLEVNIEKTKYMAMFRCQLYDQIVK